MLAIPYPTSSESGYFIGSRAQAITSSIPVIVTCIQTSGYYTVGDGGGALYIRGSTSPGSFTNTDGQVWELAETTPNIRQFGAKGDGATDDTPSFVNAEDYVVSKFNGGTIIVPSTDNFYNLIGKYEITHSNINILGDDKYTSHIRTTNTSRTNAIECNGAYANIFIQNVRISSNFNGVDPTGNGVRFNGLTNSGVFDCIIHDLSDSGVSNTNGDNIVTRGNTIFNVSQGIDNFNLCTGCRVIDNTVFDVDVYVGINTEGLAAGSLNKPYQTVVCGNTVYNCTTQGIDTVNAPSTIVTANVISGTTAGNGIQAYGSYNSTITANTSYDNFLYGIDIGPNCSWTTVTANTTSGNNSGSLYLNDGAGTAATIHIQLGANTFEEGEPTYTANTSVDPVYAEGGITLPNVFIADNILSRYLKGSFVPTVTSSGGGAFTGLVAEGYYVINGDTLTGDISISWSTAPAGDLLIGNLPAISANNISSPVNIFLNGYIIGADKIIQGGVAPNSTTINLSTIDVVSGVATPLAIQTTSVASLNIHFSYRL